MRNRRPSARVSESQLFIAIFFELSESVGDQISSSDLIKAANHLVRLIEDDFGFNKFEKAVFRSNYYSHETDHAITRRTWQILCRESAAEFLDGEWIDPLFLKHRMIEMGIFYD